MIKGFIEVTNAKTNKHHLINVGWIEEIFGNTIYFALVFNNSIIQQDYFQCKESYEEIKQKIKEAQCG